MKISTIKWFLTHPQFIPQAVEVMKRRIFDKPDRYQEKEAIEWCKGLTQPVLEVLETLGISNPDLNIQSTFSAEFKFASGQVLKTPVQMGGPGGLSTLYNVVNHFQPTKLLETGVAYGWSSLVILLGMSRNEETRLISVDMPYVSMNNESFVGTVVPEKLKGQWELIRKADRQGIPEALQKFNNELDFVHYDSDKSYSGRMWAYPILWKSLVAGGVFISDDIQDNTGFRDFCASIGQTPLIHESEGKYVGVLIKPSR